MRLRGGAVSILLLSLAGCATAPAEPPPPDLTPPAGEAATPNARLYADCIAQAAQASTYDVNRDADTQLVRFRCSGAPARAFFEALGPHSAAVGSQWSADGRTWRSTMPVRRDLFGVDYCSTSADGEAACVVTLNAGPFLDAANPPR